MKIPNIVISKKQLLQIRIGVGLLFLCLGMTIYSHYLKPTPPGMAAKDWTLAYEASTFNPDGLKNWVHVAGAVTAPGIYELAPGQRIYDAIQVAGGFLSNANPDKVNLAKRVYDGQRIWVPERKGGQNQSAIVNINKANIEAFESLPGIGPSLAQRIVEYRAEHGAFQQVSDLQFVKGISHGLLKNIAGGLTAH